MACALAVVYRDSQAWAMDPGRGPIGASPGRSAALTEAQMSLVSALAEGILPATDTPGAIDAGVPSFIGLLFSEWFTPQEQLDFQRGLEQIDAQSTNQHRCAFVACPAQQQFAMLEQWDREAAVARQAHAAPTFFGRFKSLAVLAYYTSEVAQNEELKLQFGAGQDTPEGPVVMPPPFPI